MTTSNLCSPEIVAIAWYVIFVPGAPPKELTKFPPDILHSGPFVQSVSVSKPPLVTNSGPNISGNTWHFVWLSIMFLVSAKLLEVKHEIGIKPAVSVS